MMEPLAFGHSGIYYKLCGVKWGDVSLPLQTNRKSFIEGVLNFFKFSLFYNCLLPCFSL